MEVKPDPPISSQALVLRRFTSEDAAKVYALSQESGLRTWLPDQVYENEAVALDVLQDLISRYTNPGTPVRAPYVLGVCLRGSLELIGHVGLSPLDGEVEVGFAIADRHQGRGYACEAVRAMLAWAIPRFNLPRVLGIVASDNAASCSVLERAGFELASQSVGRLHGRQGLIRVYHRLP
jgi:RimJ/RimL family protein N-acetyltransferase